MRLDKWLWCARFYKTRGLAAEICAAGRVRVNGQVIHTDPLTPTRPATHPLNCAAGYTVERVDVQGNRVLVTLRALTPGFEGPDAVPVYVAATLR